MRVNHENIMKKITLAAALTVGMAGAVNAGDIGFGGVLSINTKGEISIGARAFTNFSNLEKHVVEDGPVSQASGACINRSGQCGDLYLKSSNQFVATGGINYNFMSKSFESVLGVGYALKDGLLAAEASYSFKDDRVNWNLSGGWGNAKKENTTGDCSAAFVDPQLGIGCIADGF